jgi:hypothetical protein
MELLGQLVRKPLISHSILITVDTDDKGWFFKYTRARELYIKFSFYSENLNERDLGVDVISK